MNSFYQRPYGHGGYNYAGLPYIGTPSQYYSSAVSRPYHDYYGAYPGPSHEYSVPSSKTKVPSSKTNAPDQGKLQFKGFGFCPIPFVYWSKQRNGQHTKTVMPVQMERPIEYPMERPVYMVTHPAPYSVPHTVPHRVEWRTPQPYEIPYEPVYEERRIPMSEPANNFIFNCCGDRSNPYESQYTSPMVQSNYGPSHTEVQAMGRVRVPEKFKQEASIRMENEFKKIASRIESDYQTMPSNL